MKDIKNKLVSSKNTKNIKPRRGKMFGYHVLGFGSGGVVPPQYTVATGGTIITCGDFKTHVFTSSANMVFAKVGNVGDYPGCSAAGPAKVDYLVVGGGAVGIIGGGGAGGFRYSYPSPGCNAGTITIDGAQSIPVTVGGCQADSVFSSITSAAGGRSSHYGGAGNPDGGSGGSGGGGAGAGSTPQPFWTGGAGNVPPVSPAQGRAGGNRVAPVTTCITGAGGGGFGAVGTNNFGNGGVGGAIATAFFGPASGCYGTPGPSAGRWFSGGGGGSLHQNTPARGTGGAGGGGDGHWLRAGQATLATEAGGTNTGGGGGGGTATSGAGGSGIVAVRYRFQA